MVSALVLHHFLMTIIFFHILTHVLVSHHSHQAIFIIFTRNHVLKVLNKFKITRLEQAIGVDVATALATFQSFAASLNAVLIFRRKLNSNLGQVAFIHPFR